MCTVSVYLTSRIESTVCGLQSNKMPDHTPVSFNFSRYNLARRWFKASVLDEARSDPSLSDTYRPDGIVKISDSVYLLSEPEGPPEMDIVFIHGFQLSDNRNAYWRTWMSDNANNKEVCWPMTWLKEDFPKARISSLSIDLAMDPQVMAEALVQELVQFAGIGQQEHCPVVFVCHSLGGLMVKQIVVHAHYQFGSDPKYRGFLENIKGFFFYATPHEGSRLFDLASLLPFIVPEHGFMSELTPGNPYVGYLNARFELIAGDYYANKWQFFGAGEAHTTRYPGFDHVVVEESSARHGCKNFLSVAADHFGVCKPESKMSTKYVALKGFISDQHVSDQHPMRSCESASEERELKLMEKHSISCHELYDNREITIFRVGDRNYHKSSSISDNSILNNNLSQTRSSILDILCKMEELVKEVKIWHNQCQYLFAKYRDGAHKIVQALDILLGRNARPITGLNQPLLQFICSKLKCAMLEGETLLLNCSRNDCYTKAAFALSSPRLSKPTVSRFAFVLRELNWSVDCICYIQELYEHRDKSFDDWEWCEDRRKLVFRGNLGLGDTKDESLEDDNLRETQDREVLLASLDSKPNNLPLCSRFSHLGSQQRHFVSWLWMALWLWFWTWLWTPIWNCYNQHELESLLKKRLKATPNVTEGRNNVGIASCDKLASGVSKTHSILSYFWIENPQFKMTNLCLGTGKTKTFNTCKWLGETVAVAQCKVTSDDDSRALFETEVNLLARVQHPNVVELIGCACDDSKYTLVTELMEQDLGKLIAQQQKLNSNAVGTLASPRPPFDLPVAIDIVLQIVEAMIHSHRCGVIHRDLKPQNFLASPKIHKACSLGGHDIPVYYTIKLIDFGEAKMGGPALSFRTYMRGTCVYRAPEVYRHEESNDDHYYTLSADVYSFSMTCYEVFTGKRPLSETEWRPSEVKRFVLAGNRPLYPFPIPSLLRNLMERCWAQKPEDRLSFEDIRKELWQCKVYYAWPGLSSGRGDRNSLSVGRGGGLAQPSTSRSDPKPARHLAINQVLAVGVTYALVWWG